MDRKSVVFTMVVVLVDCSLIVDRQADFNRIVDAGNSIGMRQNVECTMHISERVDCHPEPGATREQCAGRGCCWSPLLRARDRGLPWCFYPKGQCTMANIKRIDCHPEPGASPQNCQARGCCWRSASNGLPWCYYPDDPDTGYTGSSPTATPTGFSAKLSMRKASHWPKNIPNLKLDVMMETKTRLHFKITDAANRRWEVPLAVPKVTTKAAVTDYNVTYGQSPFSMVVSRRSTGEKLFDTSGFQLTYSDQFLEITTKLPSRFVYGLGEHRGAFLKNVRNGQKLSFWARDMPPREDFNLYGIHPFFLGLGRDGSAYGVFLLNSNAMDIIISPDLTLTYRPIGGVLDFYVFTGPTPDDVIRQYSDVIGRAAMPPFWSLGFHLCRWGYKNVTDMRRIISRMQQGGFPYDVQWNDIDYMHNKFDFTIDEGNFKELPRLVDDLHRSGMRYMMIVDAGIPNVRGYKSFDDGLAMDVFVKKADGSGPIIGQVWPGPTAFPDFSHPNASDYWYVQAKHLHDDLGLKFDGIWIDMDEPSNFVAGSQDGCPGKSTLDSPPYVPGNDDSLKEKTLCPSAKHHLGPHYDLHSLFGHMEMIATNKALKRIKPGKRPFVVTRSSFAGTGHYGFHWTGDNNADYANLKYSIAAIMNNNMYGFSMVGADICGFMGSTNEELCVRWMQLGTFYTFMRNHNTIGAPDQDPANPSFSATGRSYMKKTLQLRYSLLPHLYTLLYRAHMDGVPVVRPLLSQYPRDADTYTNDQQFLWGDSLLISPVLEEGAVSVEAYIPQDIWYNYYTGEKLSVTGTVTLDAPLDTINLHIRGGTIVPSQLSANNTHYSRKTPFSLSVALPELGSEATGELFWDDGESESSSGELNGNLVKFRAQQATPITGGLTVKHGNNMPYQTEMRLNIVRVMGVPNRPKATTANGVAVPYTWNRNVLFIQNLTFDMYQHEITFVWQ